MKHLTAPATVQWELTPVCNHDCVHCYNYWRNDTEQARHPDINYLDVAKQIALAKPVHVVLTGGEPLLVFDKTVEATNYLASKNIFLSWNTNATLVTDDIAQYMRRINAGTFVSLPCGDSTICDEIVGVKNSLNRIAAGIEKLLAASVRVSVNVVISAYNEDELYSTAVFAKNLGVKQFCFAPASKPFNADDAFNKVAPASGIISKLCREAIRIEKDLGLKVALTGALPGCAFDTKEIFQRFAYTKSCTAGKLSYAIDSLGNVKACARDAKFYGNILDEPIITIWERMDEWRNGSLIPSDCQKCSHLNICKGGCRLEACTSTGKRDALDTFAIAEMIPPPFKKLPMQYSWDTGAIFKVRSKLLWQKEDFGWRVSLGPRFTYITDKTKDWIDSHNSFSLEDMTNHYGKDAETTLKTVILVLWNAGILDVL